MRILFLTDPLIPALGLVELEKGFRNIYEKHAGITPYFLREPLEYKDIPTELDGDGDTKPTVAWIKEQTARVYKKYHVDIDHVVFLVHQDNWIFSGIWGSNWSNIYNGYQVELCRYDKKNPVNSLGTLYHEVHHSHNGFMKAMTGFDIDKQLGYSLDDVTHGKAEGWTYIRSGNDNLKSLEIIAPELRKAYAKRRELWNKEKIAMLKKILQLAERTYVILQQRLNQKHT